MSSSPTRQSSDLPNEVKQILENPNNNYYVENPKMLPMQTQKLRKYIKEILQSKNRTELQKKTSEWVNYLKSDGFDVEQIIIKIKQPTRKGSDIHQSIQDGQKQQKYQLNFYPVYKKINPNAFFNFRELSAWMTMNNLTKDLIKSFTLQGKLSYREHSFSLQALCKFYSPWRIGIRKTIGAPLDNKWATDSRLFNLGYEFFNKTEAKTTEKANVFLQLEGFQTRLQRNQTEQPGIYDSPYSINMKKIDVIQSGIKYERQANQWLSKFIFTGSLGTDYYSSYFLKTRAVFLKIFNLSKKFSILSQSEAGVIVGKNLIPHTMFSRNPNKWMGQRSKIYGFQRFDFQTKGIPMMNALQTLPSNYICGYLSQSYQNKIKFEGEFGISFLILGSLKADLSLFRISGVLGEPKLLLKFQF